MSFLQSRRFSTSPLQVKAAKGDKKQISTAEKKLREHNQKKERETAAEKLDNALKGNNVSPRALRYGVG